MNLKVFRFRPGMTRPRYDTFAIATPHGMTVLGALFEAQARHDDSLAFRYSCRGAVCGTCAVLINRVPRLACRTQMEALLTGDPGPALSYYPLPEYTEPWDPKEEVIVEPLPHLPVIKDLIVDMTTFFDAYRSVLPVLQGREPAPAKEWPMMPAAVRELEQYTTCILCGACYAACPVNGKKPRYIGPAALAKLWRFRIDPRERDAVDRLRIADISDGWWACEFHTNCHRVCPKDVPPEKAIGHARQELKKMKEHEGSGEKGL
jgi:succinate dehydrogenase / fumarate reductase iron-sulfur subunit